MTQSTLRSEATNVSIPPRIERGPYLMQGTAVSLVIRWTTDIAVQGQVWYGTTLEGVSEALGS